MRLIAVLRVSTPGQAGDDRQGFPVQEKAVREWARAGGHRIVAWHRDVVSGPVPMPERPGLFAAYTAVTAGRAAGVVVPWLDRLSRDLVVQETTLAEVWRAGGKVFSTRAAEQEQLEDPTDPTRELIRVMLGGIAQYDRKMIVAKLQAGRRMKHSRGGYAGYGPPPYGWTSVEQELAPVPAEQAAIARARELAAAGGSLRAIAGTLTAEGRRPRRGSTWYPTTVARLLADRPAAALAPTPA